MHCKYCYKTFYDQRYVHQCEGNEFAVLTNILCLLRSCSKLTHAHNIKAHVQIFIYMLAVFTTTRTDIDSEVIHSTKKSVTTMLTYPWKCTVLHCNHLGNTWKPLVLMTRHFACCPSAIVIVAVVLIDFI